MTATLIGYARCSTDAQDLTAQRQALAGLGVAADRIYLDKGLTGTNRRLARPRPGPRKPSAPATPLSSRNSTGSPGPSPTPATSETPSWTAAYGSPSVAPSTTPPTRSARCSFNILATFAEFEVDLLRLRTREGMAVARAKGKLGGKQPKHTTRQQRELVRMHNTGEYSKADLAELFTVSRATVYRVLERHRATAA